MKEKIKRIQGPLFLLLAAFFWGTTFVAQSVSTDSVQPFTFNGLRMIIGSLALLPVIAVKTRGRLFAAVQKENRKRLLWGGAVCGFWIFVASSFQQFGIYHGTSAGKSGFITAMYVVIVPVFGIFLGKKIPRQLWFCILSAILGMYLLCVADFSGGLQDVAQNLSMSFGDVLTLICAVFFACQILAVDHFAAGFDGVLLSFLQFFFGGLMGLVCMFLFETPTWEGILAARGSILYSAVFSCSIAYTCQILGQKKTAPAVASILMCTEAVFAVFSDALVLKTAMTAEEICGCVFLLLALIFSALPERAKKEKTVRS